MASGGNSTSRSIFPSAIARAVAVAASLMHCAKDCGTKSSSPSSSGVNSVTTASLLVAAERWAPPAPVADEDRARRATAKGADAWRCWKLRATLTQEVDESSTSGASIALSIVCDDYTLIEAGLVRVREGEERSLLSSS